VQLLVDECIKLFQCPQVELYVLAENQQAQRCYEKVGFYKVPHSSFPLVVNNETFTIAKMRLELNPAS